MSKKTVLGVIFGGKSSEYEVSIMSAKAVMQAVDRAKFDIVTIGISREGKWLLYNGDPKKIQPDLWEKDSEVLNLMELKEKIDFALPVLHGTYGEDGTIQGLFEMLDIPYGGCGVLASSLCMDKGMAKDVFVQNQIATCKSVNVSRNSVRENLDGTATELMDYFRCPVYVKPSNMGSSVGVSRAETKEEIAKALILADRFDRRIIVEEEIKGRELEVAIMGNNQLESAGPGEILPPDDFYDYESKYKSGSGTRLIVPAEISEEQKTEFIKIAEKAYRACDCSGFARVDFFLEDETERILINEINTIPGFTKYSMFPLLFAEKGVSFSEVIERIVEYGYERYNDKNQRETVYR